MTPKEKAEKLCYLYQGDFEKDTLNMSWTMAKKCALIAVDEVLDASLYSYDEMSIYVIYWQKVKQEIENL
jgi:hypothetical protein